MELKIKKGKHRCNKILPVFKCKKISGVVTFKSDMNYLIDKQIDTNKLIGLSDSYFHHKNSIRIGWRWSNKENKLEIMSILYRNSNRYIEHICFLEDYINQSFDFKIEVKENSYEIDFGFEFKTIIRENKWFLPRYVLFPFFGGTTVAPKDFIIDITLD